jgi:hypothetical protein
MAAPWVEAGGGDRGEDREPVGELGITARVLQTGCFRS